jgi:hypothetical protein
MWTKHNSGILHKNTYCCLLNGQGHTVMGLSDLHQFNTRKHSARAYVDDTFSTLGMVVYSHSNLISRNLAGISVYIVFLGQ